MKPLRPPVTVLLGALLSSSAVWAAAPVERTLIRHGEVRFHGADPRPIGAIDFSSTVSGSRRLGPWDLKTEGLEDTGQMLFHEGGGTFSGEGNVRRYQRVPAAGRTCTTHGSVTVCR